MDSQKPVNKTVFGSPEEWKKLGFRAGLEIHHQIKTDKKLFCHCPADRYYPDWHAEVLRHMRPTMSELGEYDGTALMEFKTKKEIIYRLNRNAVCTYEMDDNPPFPINQQAVDRALAIALAFNCKMVGELHVIRKQYLDGSIPTGFQRTAIIGVDGVLPLSNGKMINIIQIGLEEDSCREVSDVGHRIIFAVDRLGFPLIEVVTAPEFETPEECAEGAMRIGRMLRATGYARRGIGAGRQDVNLSIEGGPRVEIKGVPRIPRIPGLLSYEGRRQDSLLKIKKELNNRGFKEGDRPGDSVRLELEPEKLQRPELSAALAAGDSIRAIRLPKSSSLISHPLAMNKTFANEFSGRVRVVACLDQLPNILHTDGETGGLSEQDRNLVRELAKCESGDEAVLVWGPDADTVTAVNEVLDRWAEAISGIPMETRQAMPLDVTDFERILPGPDRMYPDTDSPPYEITEERIQSAVPNVPDAPWEREERYREMGLPEEMVVRLAISRYAKLFDLLTGDGTIAPMRAAEIIINMRKAVEREDIAINDLDESRWEALLRAVGEGKLFREALLDLLKDWGNNAELSLDEILDKHDLQIASNDEIKSTIAKSIEHAKVTRPERPEIQPVIAMGFAMSILAGRTEGHGIWNRIQDTF